MAFTPCKADMTGQTVLHYKILEKLGEGGMGVVYKARDTNLDRDVALKFLPQHLLDDRAEEDRLLQEAKAAAHLNHPNICGVHFLGEFEGRRFIDMEFVDGETLGSKLRRGSLTILESVAYAIQIGEALQEAHTSGIVHRDVKADNVMVNQRNQVKVTDFGLAKLKGSLKIGRSTTTAGTMPYMAPEQLQGEEADARSDIFSLGVLLFQMVAGQLPFRGEHEAAIMYSILNEEPPSLETIRPDIPTRLCHIIERALRKNPADRYQSAADMVSDLRQCQEVAPPLPHPQGKSSPSATFTWRGKKWMRPILLVAVALIIVLAATYFLSTRSSRSYDAIAVLPFSNLSGDPSTEYLADGFTEGLINSLSVLPDIKLMSQSSVFRFKGKETAPEDAAKELGVNAVLTGRLMQRQQALAVSVELMDVRDHSHIWGEQYERAADQAQEIQKDIVQQVARRLKLTFTEDLKTQLAKGATENPDAYQLYLKGRFFLNKRTADGFDRAMDFFRQAIQQAPTYAPAYTGLATTYLLQASYDFLRPREAADLARMAAQQALRLDDRSAEAHTVLASLPGFNWAEYDREYLRALELNPNYSIAQHWYGEFLLENGKFEEGMTHLRKALELDPLAPIHYVAVALALMTQQRNDEALVQLGISLDIDPRFPRAHAMLAHLYLRMGRPELALPAIDRAILNSDSSAEYIARRGFVLGRIGKKAEAEKVSRQLGRLSKTEYIPYSLQALPYIGLGKYDEAFRLLQRACDELETAMNDINVDPMFDPLRNDPRFVRLKQKIGLR
jgi:eukaryotic-like serine/threonine-protein kinase